MQMYILGNPYFYHQNLYLSNVYYIFISFLAQLVVRWTDNPKVLGSIPTVADCFIWDNILGQDANPDCASLYPGVMGTWLEVGS